MLDSGERQVAPTPEGIRRDHVARYEFARDLIGADKSVIDLACGVGYGSAMLAKRGCSVTAIDLSMEALLYGEQHYGCENIRFVCADISEPSRIPEMAGKYDAAVCFETIEHLEDPLPMLKALRAVACSLIASVPNEAVFPFRNYKFHHRHYTRADFEALLNEAGWNVTAWHGQAGPESEVEPAMEGRTLIAVAAPVEVKKANGVPEHVTIIGLGPSCVAFFELTRRLGGASAYSDEVWGINALGDVLHCDRVFHMDDVLIQERRARARPESNIAAMLRWLKTHPGPVYTSIVRDGYPGMVAFPLEDVLNGNYDGNGGPYFNSTAAYAIAYAIHIGVKRISLFGLDYTLANAHQAEQGRACCEFWLGIAAARGIEITIPVQSTLMDACAPDRERLYGYDCVDVIFDDQEKDRIRVSMSERVDIPTADEIEARYDHRIHPNRIVQKEAAE